MFLLCREINVTLKWTKNDDYDEDDDCNNIEQATCKAFYLILSDRDNGQWCSIKQR